MHVARTLLGIVAVTLVAGLSFMFYGWLYYIPSHLVLGSIERNMRVGMTRTEFYSVVRRHGREAHAHDPFLERIEPNEDGFSYAESWPTPSPIAPHPAALVRFPDSGGFCVEGDTDLWVGFDIRDRVSKWEERRAGSTC